MPFSDDVSLTHSEYRPLTGAVVAELTIQNKHSAAIEIVVVANGDPTPTIETAGLQMKSGDGMPKLVLADYFLHLTGDVRPYAKTLSLEGVAYVSHA